MQPAIRVNAVPKPNSKRKPDFPRKLADYDTQLASWQRTMDRYETDRRFYEMELHQRELQHDLHRLTCEKDGKESASCLHHHALLHGMPLLQ